MAVATSLADYAMTALSIDATPKITVDRFKLLLKEQHPFASILDIEILEIGCGTALLLLPDRSSHQRLGGIVAGPMLMGLADLALYAAIVGATGNTAAVTASLSINFLRKAPPGGVLAHATILKTGRLAAGEVSLSPRKGGEPVAHAISTWSLPRPASAGQITG
jgi:uncharacterized protein (TIGR00369 family)